MSEPPVNQPGGPQQPTPYQPPIYGGTAAGIPMYQQAPPPPPKKKRTGLLVAGILVAVLAVLCGGVVIIGALSEAGKGTSTPPGSVATTMPAGASTTKAAVPANPPAKPSIDDFKIDVQILKLSCFDTAGANVTFRIQPQYFGPHLSNDTTFEILYQINGGEGPMSNRFTMTGSKATYDEEEFIETKTCKPTLTAVVTAINEL